MALRAVPGRILRSISHAVPGAKEDSVQPVFPPPYIHAWMDGWPDPNRNTLATPFDGLSHDGNARGEAAPFAPLLLLLLCSSSPPSPPTPPSSPPSLSNPFKPSLVPTSSPFPTRHNARYARVTIMRKVSKGGQTCFPCPEYVSTVHRKQPSYRILFQPGDRSRQGPERSMRMVEEAAFRPIPCHRHPRPSASPGAHPIIPPTILSKSLGACASIAVQPRWGGSNSLVKPPCYSILHACTRGQDCLFTLAPGQVIDFSNHSTTIKSAGWVAEQWKPTLPYGPPLGVVGGPRGDRKRKVRLEMTTLGLGSGIGGRGVIRRVRSTQKQNLLKAGEEWGVHSYFATTTRKSQEAVREREGNTARYQETPQVRLAV
ncbi:uncharacterized protein BO96DRAFT_343649 [Aspergillus niger CBS 101883]|uniref:uncharacterized protein n=1 Tax=Aspergillus lacticoffeatus (strain CBS 101883) TaxID=1450533 RepID=UPI000D7F3DC8|nr:uncharacterized protein BO96DRAFT_343649 [Aspergillus niger CBS 101883]PYH54013.1 hypothetical protein BO96DRAFT_343649 [Aspergillus niger CBS 101883]